MDWYEDKEGNIKWEKDVTKDNIPKGGTYIGTEYMGFSIFQNSGIDASGMSYSEIRIYYSDTENIVGWVQTVDTNVPRKGDEKPRMDHGDKEYDNFLYYQTKSGFKDSKYHAKWDNGTYTKLYDRPSRYDTQDGFSW